MTKTKPKKNWIDGDDSASESDEQDLNDNLKMQESQYFKELDLIMEIEMKKMKITKTKPKMDFGLTSLWR